jgi:hypothetical protein
MTAESFSLGESHTPDMQIESRADLGLLISGYAIFMPSHVNRFAENLGKSALGDRPWREPE